MASRFWLGGGDGLWDATAGNKWGTSSGSGAGASVPGSGDTVTFDGSSGACTGGVGYNPSITTLVLSAYTNTLDFLTNNNSISVSGNWTDTGSGAHTITMGSGTITLSSATASMALSAANITFNCGTSTISYTSTTPTGVRDLTWGGKTIYNLNVVGCTGSNAFPFTCVWTAGATMNALTLAGPLMFGMTPNVTLIISAASVWTGTGIPTGMVNVGWSSRVGANKTLIQAGGAITGTYCAIEGITKSGAGTMSFTNSIDLGGNTLTSLTGPSSGSGVIGG